MRISDWSSDVCSSDLTLREDWNALENVAEGLEFVEVGGKRKHVIGYLQDFLFTPERARAPITRLSGGERNRLLLAKLFAQPSNLLVMDEPTNDLDMETLELLEELLADYRSEEHTSELQSLMRISYAVFCLKKKKKEISTTPNQI